MLLRSLPTSLLALLTTILYPAVHAESSIRNPIGAISTVQNATIHTRYLTALSEFDLSFNIRDDIYVKLQLEPNHDILAEDATISYLAPDGTIQRTESVDRMAHNVYKGTAWIMRPRIGQHRWHMVGWSRIVVSREGNDPLFEGAFSVENDHHHIQTATNYRQTRHELDPTVEETVDGDDYMVIWRDSDILRDPSQQKHQDLRRADVLAASDQPATCQANQLSFNTQPDHPVFAGVMKRSDKAFGYMDFSTLFAKRQIDGTGQTGGNGAGVNLSSTVGQSNGCPTTRKVALVGVATDCTYTATFNSTASTKQNVITQMNTASAIWENAFNISLGLQNITISDPSCPGTPAAATMWNQACNNSVQIGDRLNYFSGWRGLQQDTNSHWTLLSTCNTGSAVGLAWLGQACVNTVYTTNVSSSGGGGVTAGTETVSGANVVIKTSGANEWQIIAHETGHTFGAVHDCDSDTCANSAFVASQQCCPLSGATCDANAQYIMNPAAVMGVKTFSPCTVGNICSALLRNSVNSTCLTANKQITTINGQQCGNGIVEAGEDCDCGGTDGCGGDKCCNPTTCKFTTGSVCDDANEDCCLNCQFKGNGTVCRASTGFCDPAETCTGTSATCPPNENLPDGRSCGNGDLACASGQCTSRDQQCKSVMGTYTQGNDTYACDDSTCYISCGSPEFGANVCYSLQQNFLDGTPCGGNGHCSNGLCHGSTVGGQVKSWVDEHKGLVIGLAAAVGFILLLALLTGIFGCWRRRSRRNKGVPPPRMPAPPAGGWTGWNGNRNAAPPVQPQMEQRGGAAGLWRDGYSAPPVPQPPPMAHGAVARGQSVRYA